MNLYRFLTGPDARPSHGRILGVVVGIVTNNDDPDKLGRVKVKFPWLAANEESAWARVASPYAGKQRGAFALPQVGDEVLIAFELGRMERPYVVGALWNGVEPPPTAEGDGRDRKVLFRSKAGHVIRVDDTGGSEKIEILDKTGKNSVVFDSAANTVTVSADKDIVLQAPQGKIKLDAQELDLRASGSAKIEASGTTTIKGATVNLN